MNMEKIANLLVRWRWLFVLLTLGAVMAAVSGGRFMGFATDYEYWFSKDNPELIAFKKLQNTYNKSDNVIFYWHRKTAMSLATRRLPVWNGSPGRRGKYRTRPGSIP